MDFERILGAILFLSGVFLFTNAVLSYAHRFNFSAIVSASNPFFGRSFDRCFLGSVWFLFVEDYPSTENETFPIDAPKFVLRGSLNPKLTTPGTKNFGCGRMKIKCFRFECSQCGEVASVQVFYRKDDSVGYARARHKNAQGFYYHKIPKNMQFRNLAN